MSQAQPRPAAPNPKRNVKAIRTVRFWMAPIATTLALMSALAALYLGGILNPMTNLRHFPIALVNEDAGPAGQQIVDGLVSGGQEQFRHPSGFAGRGQAAARHRGGVRLGADTADLLVAATGLRGECGDANPHRPARDHDLNESAGGHAGS